MRHNLHQFLQGLIPHWQKLLDRLQSLKNSLFQKIPKGVRPSLFQQGPAGKRPEGFAMPEWAKKDYFSKKDMGSMVPPEELAQGSRSRGPEERGGKKPSQPKEVGLSDGQLQDFLGDFLDQEKGKPPAEGKKKEP